MGVVTQELGPTTAPSSPPSLAARVLDGRVIAAEWTADVRAAIRGTAARRPPGLAVLLVGEAVDSLLYVRRKRDACVAAGICFHLVHLPEAASQAEVVRALQRCAGDDAIHGVLVQLPLPPHLDEEAVLEAVGVEKDVDGFHPVNVGRLSMRGRSPPSVPCTPKGLMELLRRSHIPVAGCSAVVLGNSNTVGTPLSMLLRNCGAEMVTICHTAHSADRAALLRLAAVSRTADVLVAAVGRPGLVRAHWVKPGATVLDVGINAVASLSDELQAPPCAEAPGERLSVAAGQRFRIVGDVAYDEVSRVAGALTPVPGGVGPMTIAALLDNVLHAWLRRESP